MAIEVKRIEKEVIFQSLENTQASMNVHGSGFQTEAKLKHAEEQYLELEITGETTPAVEKEERINVFFHFSGNTMTFHSTVFFLKENVLRISNPSTVYKELERHYERISMPDGIEASFRFEGDKVELNFPKTTTSSSPEIETFNDRFDNSSITELITQFRERMRQEVSYNTIIMFRERQPSTFEENLIIATGKPLFIPSPNAGFPDTDLFPSGNILTTDDMISWYSDNGIDKEQAKQKIRNLVLEKHNNGIYTELYCPIIYHEYVVGYVYIANKSTHEKAFGAKLFTYVYHFSRVLAYSLSINAYFQASLPDKLEHNAQIMDISASGMLFSHSSEHLKQTLIIGANISIVLVIKKRKVLVEAQVVRRFKGKDMIYYGIQFLKMKPEDFRFLYEYIYGKTFQKADERRWESDIPSPSPDLF